MSGEFIEPTPASRRNLALLLAVSCLVGVLLIEFMEARLDGLKATPMCDSIIEFRSWVVLVLGGLAACGSWLAWIAHRVLKLKQLPLPGTWVFRRTPIHRGGSATWRGYALLVVASYVIGVSAIVSYISWDLADRVELRCVSQSHS